jgi:hypothetical protein
MFGTHRQRSRVRKAMLTRAPMDVDNIETLFLYMKRSNRGNDDAR